MFTHHLEFENYSKHSKPQIVNYDPENFQFYSLSSQVNKNNNGKNI